MQVRKTLLPLLFALGFLRCAAQTAPSAVASRNALWAGAEVSIFNPDYGCADSVPFSCSGDLLGLGVTATYDLRPKLVAAGEARWMEWNGPSGETEASYLLGPQYRLWNREKLSLDANVLFGVAHFSSRNVIGTYFAYAPGAELSYRASPRLQAFLGYQFQFWPSFAGPPTVSSTSQTVAHDHGLSPNGFSVGVRYRAF